jgi:hypothetical protein
MFKTTSSAPLCFVSFKIIIWKPVWTYEVEFIELKDGITVDTFDSLRNPEEAKRHKELLYARSFSQNHLFLKTRTFSNKGEGLYTAGVENLLFAPLDSLSDKAQEIIPNARKRIEAEIASGKYSPQLTEQYLIQLEKLENKVPLCELIGFPVLFGGASNSFFFL